MGIIFVLSVRRLRPPLRHPTRRRIPHLCHLELGQEILPLTVPAHGGLAVPIRDGAACGALCPCSSAEETALYAAFRRVEATRLVLQHA